MLTYRWPDVYKRQLVGIVEFQHIAVIGNGVLVALGALADQALIVQFLDVVGIECDVSGKACLLYTSRCV